MGMQRIVVLCVLLLQIACFVIAKKQPAAKPLSAAESKAKETKDKANKMNKFISEMYKGNSFAELSKNFSIKVEHKLPGLNGRASPGANGLMPSALMVKEDTKDATPGKCDPKPVCISNPLTLNITSNNQIVFPPCINIHRCDGCCPTNEKCVATKTHEVKLSKVYIINFEGESGTSSEENVITVSNHTDCECRCRWESDKDCKTVNPNYIKDPYSCNCICPEEMMCGSYHEFDSESCACVCKRSVFSKIESTCRSRGYSWNETACKCEAPTRPK